MSDAMDEDAHFLRAFPGWRGRQKAVRGRPLGRAERRKDAHPYRMALGDQRKARERGFPGRGATRYRGHYGASTSERRALRDLERGVFEPIKVDCGYYSGSESGSDGLDDGDSWDMGRSKGSDLASSRPSRAAPSAHAYVRPSSGCCSRRSTCTGPIDSSGLVSGVVGGDNGAGGR
jgi:hypothetical protein